MIYEMLKLNKIRLIFNFTYLVYITYPSVYMTSFVFFRVRCILLAFILFSTSLLFGGEGMWLPFLLKSLNEAEMKSMGMKMSAEDIYSVNKGSLKDAVVHFGGFCTAEVISDQGLILTNHHCGYDAIQTHSTLEKNYLTDVL